jgi:hypothetical protein
MDPEDLDLEKIMGGAILGATVAFLHHIIAGVIIAPIMSGSLFYAGGPGMLGFIISDTVVMTLVGAVLGAIGAFVAPYIEIGGSNSIS